MIRVESCCKLRKTRGHFGEWWAWHCQKDTCPASTSDSHGCASTWGEAYGAVEQHVHEYHTQPHHIPHDTTIPFPRPVIE